MKPNPQVRITPENELIWRPMGAAVVAITLTCFGVAVLAAPGGKGKGNGNNDGDVGGDVAGEIFSEFQFDDGESHILVSDDGGSYIYGTDMVEIVVGRNFNMQFDFNTHKKKASLRNLRLHGDLQPVEAGGITYDGAFLVGDPANPCTPVLDVGAPLEAAAHSPDLVAGEVNVLPDAHLRIFGQDHDDSGLLCTRHVNAELSFTDLSGEKWVIFFGSRPHGSGSLFAPCGSCLQVTRLENVNDAGDPGFAQWEIRTEDHNLGYLYHDNRPPHAPTALVGIVQVPFSGVLTSLTQEDPPVLGGPCLDDEECPNTGWFGLLAP